MLNGHKWIVATLLLGHFWGWHGENDIAIRWEKTLGYWMAVEKCHIPLIYIIMWVRKKPLLRHWDFWVCLLSASVLCKIRLLCSKHSLPCPLSSLETPWEEYTFLPNWCCGWPCDFLWPMECWQEKTLLALSLGLKTFVWF